MWRFGCGAVLCGALIGGVATPAIADDGQGTDAGSVLVGGFSVGDGLEAMIDERAGSLRFRVAIGGLSASWDSRRAGADRAGLGAGWDWTIASVDTEGGVRVFPASGGVYEADASVTSGLRGYGVGDVRFEQRDGVLPAREGVVDARPYSYVLTELGGVTTYFSAAGDALAKDGVGAGRTDWLWSTGRAHRLVGVVDTYGARTELVWGDATSSLVVRPAVNAGGTPAHEWRAQLGSAGVASVTDPLGHVTSYGYAEAGLVSAITGASGAATSVTWQLGDDGVARVDELTTADPSGAVLSSRTWATSGTSVPTGWPATAQPGAAGFETVLADGASQVVSTYSAAGLLTHRELHVSTPAGTDLLQTVDYTYPETSGVDPSQLPGNWSRPSATEITHMDASGASRTIAESSAFDESGRMVERTAADGSVTRTEYDPTPVGDAGVPSGLVLRETVETTDGLTRERVNTPNDAHTAIVGTEVRESRAGGESAVVERIEFDVDDDGFVREQRVYPQGGASAAPVVTRWSEQVALAKGTVTRSETVAAGSAAEATTSQMSSLVHGAEVEAFDELGNRTRTEYDVLGRPIALTDAAGRTATTTYTTERGRSSVTTTTPDGVARTETQDALGRVVEVTDNVATVEGEPAAPVPGHVRRVESREYRPGQVSITDAWGATSSSTQDVYGRTTAVEAATGAVEVTEYDDTAGTTRHGATATGDLADAALVHERRRDAGGNVVAATDTRADDASATQASTQFDGLGRVTSTIGGGIETRVDYDALGRAATTSMTATGAPRADQGATGEADAAPSARAEVADAGSLTASVDFDAFGRSTGKTLADGSETRSGYTRALDELGRTIEETDQSGAWTRYGYTVDGLVAWTATSAGQRTDFEYDTVSREPVLERVTSQTGIEVARVFGYDDVTGRASWVADAGDPERTRIEYEYDAFGNVVSVTYPDGAQVRTRYDEHGRKASVTDVAGNRTDLAYTEAGLLASAVQTDQAGDELARVSYEYDRLGRVRALHRGNGLVTEYEFTSADEVASERTTQAGALLDERTYTYDASGDLIRRVDVTRDGVDAEPVTTATEYAYDGFHRLVGSRVRAGDAADAAITRRTEYELSLAGNIAAETVHTDPGGEMETSTIRRFGYSARGELLSITTESAEGTRVAEQAYDASGNLMLGADGDSYVFDAANRPVAHTAADGTVTATEYWADGSRKLQRTGEHTTTFHWDGETLLNETVEADDGAGVASYLIGAARHARSIEPGEAESSTSYYGTDRHGNVTDLTDRDGLVTVRYGYTDYGVATRTPVGGHRPESGVARNPFQYAGEHTDRAGTQHLATRSYDAGSMHFISMDTAPLENRFAFADLNPIMHVDPTGQTSGRDVLNYLVAGVGTLLAIASIGLAIAALPGTLTWLSIGAFAADVVAAGAAMANIVDAHFKDFMDDDTANWVMVAEIALPIGAALGAYVVGRMWGKWGKWQSIKVNLEDGFDASADQYGRRNGVPENVANVTENFTPFPSSGASKTKRPVPVFKGTTEKARRVEWRELKSRMQDFNGQSDVVLSQDSRKAMAETLMKSPLFQRLSGLHPKQAPVPYVEAEELTYVSVLESTAADDVMALKTANDTLVQSTRSNLLAFYGKSFSVR